MVQNLPQTENSPNKNSGIIVYTLAAVLSLIGLFDALYLAVEHISGRSVRCTIVTGCDEVLSSPYAAVAGIPLALIGAIAYFACFSLVILAIFGYRLAGNLLTILVVLMFLVTLILLYLQAFVIGYFCQFCLVSAGVTIILTILVAVRYYTSLSMRS